MRTLTCFFIALAAARPANTPAFEHWTGAQLSAFSTSLVQKMSAQKVATQPLGNYGNHAIMVLHREGPGEAEFHKTQADVFIVQSGQASILVGGSVVDPKPLGAKEIRGSSIQGGQRYTLGPGDIVHIPSNTPHQVIVESGKQITYAIVKVND